MNELAMLDEHDTVTLVRDLPGPIERVWSFLTDPAMLERWFSEAVITPRVGGDVRFAMGADGTITAFEPPHVFEYTWNEREREQGVILDTVVRWELAQAGERVKLTLTHRLLSHDEAVWHSAGWHAFVDRLIAALDGTPLPDLRARYNELEGVYEERYGVTVS